MFGLFVAAEVDIGRMTLANRLGVLFRVVKNEERRFDMGT